MIDNEPVELELSLRREDGARYGVEARVRRPDSEADTRPLEGRPAITLDFQALDAAWPDVAAYGRRLGEMLFGEPAVARVLREARLVAQSLDRPLRLHLALDNAPDLHNLRWESIRSPVDDMPLASSEQVVLARVLGSADWRPVQLRPRGVLRVLVAIAAPVDLAEYHLAPIDAVQEAAWLRKSLAPLPCTVLERPGEAGFANIVAELRRDVDILYLIAHGRLVDGQPWLYLDNGHGKVIRIAGAELVRAVNDLRVRPRLVVLASCEGAGNDTGQALTALGPRLATTGVPAVIAMQGRFSLETNQTFTRVFFQHLAEEGRVDLATARARQAVMHRPDWWAPVLFTRLRSDRIWYTPGFGEDFSRWPALLNTIRAAKCTPILGPGLLESYLGSSRDLARRLAERHAFPLAPFARDDLPQVMQYLSTSQDTNFMFEELKKVFRETLQERLGDGVVPEGGASAYLSAAGQRRRASDRYEPFRLLAAMPFPIYLTASPDHLLMDGLKEAGKNPQMCVCRWYAEGEDGRLTTDQDLPAPTVERPLVYYLFGELNQDEGLVLTEDDYFHYLTRMAANPDIVPSVVQKALSSQALLFLGFRLDDWSFRVLFQSILQMPGAHRRRHYTHVAVQIDPEEETLIDPRAARRFLTTRFGEKATEDCKMSIYWGRAEDFLRDLTARLEATEA